MFTRYFKIATTPQEKSGEGNRENWIPELWYCETASVAGLSSSYIDYVNTYLSSPIQSKHKLGSCFFSFLSCNGVIKICTFLYFLIQSSNYKTDEFFCNLKLLILKLKVLVKLLLKIKALTKGNRESINLKETLRVKGISRVKSASGAAFQQLRRAFVCRTGQPGSRQSSSVLHHPFLHTLQLTLQIAKHMSHTIFT